MSEHAKSFAEDFLSKDNPQINNTPRTDKEVGALSITPMIGQFMPYVKYYGHYYSGTFVTSEFARELERDLRKSVFARELQTLKLVAFKNAVGQAGSGTVNADWLYRRLEFILDPNKGPYDRPE